MARKKKTGGGGGAGEGWLVTFSDLTTLLLTFFVLLLTMSSMDRSVLTKVSLFTQDLGNLQAKGAGKITTRQRLLQELLERPWEVMEKTNRIKDLLFPEDSLPPDLSRSTLDENLMVLQRPEGVALVLTEKLLFPPGGYELSESAKKILGQVVEVFSLTDADVNIAGYTDNTPGQQPDNLTLSGLRAMSVLEYFLSRGVPDRRFSVAGYGPFWPIADNDTPQDQAKNRRVEILLRTTPWLAGYTQ
jgi:chemotaxis protein MotB